MFVFYIYPDQCCNELELDLEYPDFNHAMGFVGTVFKKQSFFSNHKVVYHDRRSGYYIYNAGDKWVVRYKIFISHFFLVWIL